MTILNGEDTVSSFTLAPFEAVTLFFKLEEEVTETAGRVDDALAGAVLPKDDTDSVVSADFVKCEAPTPKELRVKLAELSDAMSAVYVDTSTLEGAGACGPESWPEGDVPMSFSAPTAATTSSAPTSAPPGRVCPHGATHAPSQAQGHEGHARRLRMSRRRRWR